MAAYFETFRNKRFRPNTTSTRHVLEKYFGLPVWMPFLDREFIDLMHNLPLEYRWGKRIYESSGRILQAERGLLHGQTHLFRN